MPSTCKFRLSTRNGVYFSGEVVRGTIVLRTTSDKNIKNIRLRLLGQAKVHWSESEDEKKSNDNHESGVTHYRGHEVYVNKTTIVYEDDFLPAGTYVYPIKFRLPKSCPTSCRGNFGHIHYSLELTVDRPYRYDNVFSRTLTVLKTVDLNLKPEYKVPLLAEEISSIGCWPCRSGNIIYTLRVPFGAYASGQTLQYTLNIRNQSMSDVQGYKVEFIEYMTYFASRPDHNECSDDEIIVSEEYSDKCQRLSNRQFEGEIDLPSLPSDTNGRGIIHIEHGLRIEVILNGCHSNRSISVPIVMGNVPIKESLEPRQPPSPLSSSQLFMDSSDEESDRELPSGSAQPLTSSSDEDSDTDKPPSYADLKPPSFEEAVRSSAPFLDPDADEYNNAKDYHPLYPSYRYSQGKR